MNLDQPSWAPLDLPHGISIILRQTLELPRPGPGGATTVYVADLIAGSHRLTLLVLQRPKVLPRDLRAVRDLLRDAETSWLSSLDARQAATIRPTVVAALSTDAAGPALISAATENDLAIIDRRGTIVIEQGPVFIHVRGTGRLVREAHRPSFVGKSGRVMRLLLTHPLEKFTAQAMAAMASISYVYAHNVLAGLEHAGYLERASPRSGFSLRDPAGLLRERTSYAADNPPAIQGYYAPSVSAETLRSADAARNEAGLKGIFTLASALHPDEVHASALPHGIYVSGDPAPIVEAMGLRRMTPFNFFVLRAEPAADTAAGGVYLEPRSLQHGLGVAIPQLCGDFAAIGGRGAEQAESLTRVYAERFLKGTHE
jgi:hypothetical protein